MNGEVISKLMLWKIVLYFSIDEILLQTFGIIDEYSETWNMFSPISVGAYIYQQILGSPGGEEIDDDEQEE